MESLFSIKYGKLPVAVELLSFIHSRGRKLCHNYKFLQDDFDLPFNQRRAIKKKIQAFKIFLNINIVTFKVLNDSAHQKESVKRGANGGA